MTSPRLLLDEMLSAPLALALNERGLDVEAVVERRELVGGPDEALLEVAAREDRVLVTKNVVDVVPLSQQWVATGRTHAGLVLISTRRFAEARDWIGAVTAALAQARLPAPGELLWLSPYTS